MQLLKIKKKLLKHLQTAPKMVLYVLSKFVKLFSKKKMNKTRLLKD